MNNNIIEVTGGQGGDTYLLIGTEKTALVDCGMAYCASNLIANIKQVLGSRELNYVFISHSHYDHIGAIPYLKKEWPFSKVLGADYAKRILNRPGALRTIRQLSQQAAELFSSGQPIDYDDGLLKIDHAIGNNDVVSLGDMFIKVIATPGHTQCSLSFLLDNETMFASETTGYMSKTGRVYPAFITSYIDAVRSIAACQSLKPRFIISPHYGLVSEEMTPGYWKNCLLAVQEAREYILYLAKQGNDMERIIVQYEKLFRDEHSRLEQPWNAFRLNTEGMVKTVLREYQSLSKVK